MPLDTSFSSDLDAYLQATRQRMHGATNLELDDNNHDSEQISSTEYDRYLYNADRDIWYDTQTNTYSKYDSTRQIYIPVSMAHENAMINDSSQQQDGESGDGDEPESDATCRLVVVSSTVIPVGQVILMDANGMTVGRDKHEWDTRRLRLRDMQVSKYHCQFYYDQKKDTFAVTDVGSQNGTFLNGQRLSPAKQSSTPFDLKHLDQLDIGVTVLQVHLHDHGWPCQECQTSAINPPLQTTDTSSITEKKSPEKSPMIKKENPNKQWKRRLLKQSDDNDRSTHYIDRAQLRRERTTTNSEDDYQRDFTALIDVHTPVQGKGYDMLRKMGWQHGQGMGSSEQGIVEPLTPTTSVYERAGIGALSMKDWQYQQMKQRYSSK